MLPRWEITGNLGNSGKYYMGNTVENLESSWFLTPYRLKGLHGVVRIVLISVLTDKNNTLSQIYLSKG